MGCPATRCPVHGRDCASRPWCATGTVMGIMGLIKHGDGRSVLAVDIFGLCSTVAFASVPLHCFRSGPMPQYPLGGVADREVVG